MELACLDLEGVLIPEIWIGFAMKTGIDELKATTRDIPDYNVLMRPFGYFQSAQARLARHSRGHCDDEPLEGATEFVSWLKVTFQLIILSDTFYAISPTDASS